MTPTPDREPIREGLARELAASYHGRPVEDAYVFGEATGGNVFIDQADACLTYLIKRQAFLYDVYERIKEEMK